jgi:hypothetical protein
MLGSSESWLHQQQPYSWHSRAGGGAVHSINSGYYERWQPVGFFVFAG